MNTSRRYTNYIEGKFDEKDSRGKYIKHAEREIQGKTSIGNKLIEKFLTEKDVAPWFRGTSYYHIIGADKLFNALRDDAEQRTTHRVRSCLNLIGLEPMITSKQITFLMRLSRCNDLIFLWFLMEMHYKTPKPGIYSVNEQLICSAICHLDMVTTLRELDKILPSGNTPRIEIGKSANLECKQVKSHTLKKNKIKDANKYASPYFMKYPRPKHYGKSLTLKIPNFKVKFSMYGAYRDHNYNVQNETNRWFANYKFNIEERIVHYIIREILEYIFGNLDTAFKKTESSNILCNYHKNIEIMKNNFKAGDDQQNYVKRIRELLDVAVKNQLYELDKNNRSKQKLLTLKTITSDSKIFNVILDDNTRDNKKLNSKQEIYDSSTKRNCVQKNEKHKKEIIENKILSNTKKIPLDMLDKKISEEYNRYLICTNNDESNVSKTSQANQVTKSCNRNKYDFGNKSDTTSPSEIVFHRSMNNKPFTFDYMKILLPTYKDSNKRRIQKMFLEALDNNILNLSEELERSDLKYDKAVTECAKSIFKNEVKKYEDSIKDQLRIETAEKQKPLNQYSTLSNYNAEDHILMDQMLLDAFQYLRKNPKFVWAQLPDAHKVPMLREWIARRFGKEYSHKERITSYRMSCKIFRALGKNHMELSSPNSNQIGRNHFLNYNYRNYLEKKVKHIKKKYYYHLDSSFLEYTRIFWFAMRGYICANGPPRKTFFAYMPSKYRDIQHFRLWKSSEYRNYKISRNDYHHQKQD